MINVKLADAWDTENKGESSNTLNIWVGLFIFLIIVTGRFFFFFKNLLE